MGGFFTLIKEFFVALSNKKGATLAGALVFFTLLGIVPVTYIVSLIFSIFGTEIEMINKLFSYPEFNEIAIYLTETAKKMGASGNILVFLVALYSSGNVFYHLKQSGEVIYNYSKKSGIITRLFSVLFTFLAVFALSLVLVFYLAVIPVIIRFLGYKITAILNIIIALVLVFFLSILINLYACPYKLEFYEVYKGALFTTAFTFVATYLFLIYLRYFSNFNEIYGKVATVIVFLSWLYLMIKGVVNGIILNVFLIGKTKRVKGVESIKILKPNAKN